jgi:hypothetical protein
MVALNEAAVAWRSGDSPTARTLADRAKATWERTGETAFAALAEALAMASGAPVREEDPPRLLAIARTCGVPGIALQIVGLLVRAAPETEARAAAAREVIGAPYGDANVRREILAPAECLIETSG